MLRVSAIRCGLSAILAALLAGSARAQEAERLSIYVMDIEKAEVQELAAEPRKDHSYCGSPEWSYDGKRIVFDASPGKQFSKTHLFAADYPVQKPNQFTDLGPGNCPTWSPDASQIAFLLNSGAVPGAESGIWIMNADGTQRRRLGGYGIPKWSPDGKSILAVSFSNPCNLTLHDTESGQDQAITLEGHSFHSVPSWAGNAQTLIAVIRAEGPLMIALVDITEPAAAKVKEVLWTRGQGTTAEPMYPTYSAATKRVAFAGRVPKGSSLYLLESKTSFTPKQLEPDRYDPKVASLAISPDGRHLLFCSLRPANQEPNAPAK